MLATQRVPTIFRYPGSKSRREILNIILGAFPEYFTEYREPFVGSGAVALCVDPTIPRLLNDLDDGLMAVYDACLQRPEAFFASLRSFAPARPDEEVVELTSRHRVNKRFLDLFDRAADGSLSHDPAVNWYIVNRLVWSGRVIDIPSRLYMTDARKFDIAHRPGCLEAFASRLKGCLTTCTDFAELLVEPAHSAGRCFVYCDPPYVADALRGRSQRLYKKHFTVEDHERLADVASRSPHLVLISLDDHPLVRHLYRHWAISAADWHYHLSKTTGKELLISNYAHTITDFSAHFADLGRRTSERKTLAARQNAQLASTPEARAKMRAAWDRRRQKQVGD